MSKVYMEIDRLSVHILVLFQLLLSTSTICNPISGPAVDFLFNLHYYTIKFNWFT